MADRTDKDYAIEHAGYMADAVKHYLSLLDAEFEAAEAMEAADADDAEQKADNLRSIEEEVSEARSVLRNRVYEFEKRRDRALGVTKPVGINGLTESETSATASVMGIVGAPTSGASPRDADGFLIPDGFFAEED